jgi:hypothetical protein
MEAQVQRIAIVQGAPSAEIQRLLGDFVGRWRSAARIVGVLEEIGPEGSACSAGQLISLTDGARFSIFQDQGGSSSGCNADPAGTLSAGEAVRHDIEAGCDLVVLSKFGKLEAEQKGALVPAFVAAAEAAAPILTSVSPKFEPVWRQFTEGAYVSLPARAETLDAWWKEVRGRVVSP